MLRILHTSDWHLGLELGGHDRLEEQKLFLDWLLETCEEQRINALLICGDVYDTTNPSVAAQRLFAEFLVNFHTRLPKASLVTIAGNHDSAARLELPRPFGQALGNVYLRGVVQSQPSEHLLCLPDHTGTPAAWCVALPFLRASDLDCRVSEGETPQSAFQRAVATVYQEVRKQIPPSQKDLPVIAMGHLTLAGSARAGSERILIGGVESVPVMALADSCDYVALGHIHRSQTVGSDTVRYCGSPYPVDFGEFRYRHEVLVVDLESQQPVQIKSILVPEFVPFLRFNTDLTDWDGVESAVESFDWSPWKDVPRALCPLVELRYDASAPVADLRQRCEKLCNDRPFRLVSAPRAMNQTVAQAIENVEESERSWERESPEAILEKHWSRQFPTPLPDGLRQRFLEVVTEVSLEGPSS